MEEIQTIAAKDRREEEPRSTEASQAARATNSQTSRRKNCSETYLAAWAAVSHSVVTTSKAETTRSSALAEWGVTDASEDEEGGLEGIHKMSYLMVLLHSLERRSIRDLLLKFT